MEILSPYEQARQAAEARRQRDKNMLELSTLATAQSLNAMDAMVPPLVLVDIDSDNN